jgi:hypothetical protein
MFLSLIYTLFTVESGNCLYFGRFLNQIYTVKMTLMFLGCWTDENWDENWHIQRGMAVADSFCFAGSAQPVSVQEFLK